MLESCGIYIEELCVRRSVLWLREVKNCCVNCVGEKCWYEFKVGLIVCVHT